jgi:hypothetical protein
MVHAQSAERIVRPSSPAGSSSRAAIATSVAVVSLLIPGRGYQIATLVTTSLALVAFAIRRARA